MSHRVMQALGEFAPSIEVYSIDESFLDLTNLLGRDLNAYCWEIKRSVMQWTKIPISLGVAPTKALAKVANRLAKKSQKAKGVLVLTDPYHISEALKATKIEDVWGVGRQYTKLLRKHGVETAYDFTLRPDSWVKKHMAVVGLRLVKELRGESCLELDEIAPPKKGICTSRSFGERLTEYSQIEEATANYAAKCAKKLRKQRSCARVISVFIQTNHFSENDLQYSNSKTITLPVATNSDLELIHYASLCLKSIYRPGYRYKKTGVILTEIVPDHQIQYDLLDTVDRQKHASLMKSLDKLTSRYGRDIVKVATQGYDQSWQLKCERRSPCYTTRLSDLPIVCNER